MNNIRGLTTGLIYRGARRKMENCIKTVNNLQKPTQNCKNCRKTER